MKRGAVKRAACIACVLLAGCTQTSPFVVRVVSFTPGEGGGFGAGALPGVVLGAPKGGGRLTGSLDVLSLGRGGEIVVELGVTAVDRPGADLIVFENAFFRGGSPTSPFGEPAFVSVSQDGVAWLDFPCMPERAPTYDGCAGVTPVLASDTNGIDPLDPSVAGGDAFDLAAIGARRARFVRLRDAGLGEAGAMGTTGFDLDAVAVVHAE